MIIDYHKRFVKHYDKLNLKLKQKTDEAIALFQLNPFNPILDNHALANKMHSQRGFSVTGNYRVTFEECDDYKYVLLLDVGTHNQVYY